MTFVTLVCICVAGYFLWDAWRDKRIANTNHATTSSHSIDSTLQKNSAASQGQGAAASHGQAGEVSPAATTAQSNDGQQVKSSGQSHITNNVAPGRQSANDPDMKSAVAIGAAAGTASAAVAATHHDASQNQQNQTNQIRFLDGPIGRKDDLTRINGVGPVIEEGLNRMGVFHYHQIANFTDTDIHYVNTELDFPGRIERENWVEQARKLSSISLDQASLVSTNEQLDSVVSIDEHAVDISAQNSVLTVADYTGVWNTDVLVEVQERLKVLNTRESDAPRLRVSEQEYIAIKNGDDSTLTRDRLIEILERLRELDQ